MTVAPPRRTPVHAGWHIVLALAGLMSASGLAAAQENTVHQQPRADALPSPTLATANGSQRILRPEGMLPQVSAGFALSSYACLLYTSDAADE